MYGFYVEEYNGIVIPNVTAFKSVINEAAAYVDSFVLNRDNLKYESVDRRYKMAICAAADVLYQAATVGTGTQKQSESVGNHSVSYSIKTAAEYDSEKHSKVMTYLYGTGLMYSAL